MTIEGAPNASFIRFEYFPAQIDGVSGLPPGDLKAYVTDRDLVVFANSQEGPVLAFSGAIEDFQGRNKETQSWNLTLEGGTEVRISRADSCGCGSRLRGLAAYPGKPRRRI